MRFFPRVRNVGFIVKFAIFSKVDEFSCKLRFKAGKTLPVITLVNEHIFLASRKTKLTHGFPRDPDIKCTVVNPFRLAYVGFDGGGIYLTRLRLTYFSECKIILAVAAKIYSLLQKKLNLHLRCS